nr:sulfotransferase domain-containing protein [Maioricimonas rarisocia]
MVVGKIIHTHYGIENADDLFLTESQVAQTDMPRLFIAHDYDSPALLTSEFLGRRYAGKRVLLMLRDVRDALVSAYHHAHSRTRTFDGTISDYVRSEAGAGTAIQYFKAWHDCRAKLADFLLIRYEDMHVAHRESIRKSLEFLGVHGVSDHVIDEGIEFGRFENMRKLEVTRNYSARELQPRSGVEDSALKVRKGQIGTYKEELSKHDLQYIEALARDLNGPIEWLFWDPETERSEQ